MKPTFNPTMEKRNQESSSSSSSSSSHLVTDIEEIKKAVKDGKKEEAMIIINRVLAALTVSADIHGINAEICTQGPAADLHSQDPKNGTTDSALRSASVYQKKSDKDPFDLCQVLQELEDRGVLDESLSMTSLVLSILLLLFLNTKKPYKSESGFQKPSPKSPPLQFDLNQVFKALQDGGPLEAIKTIYSMVCSNASVDSSESLDSEALVSCISEVLAKLGSERFLVSKSFECAISRGERIQNQKIKTYWGTLSREEQTHLLSVPVDDLWKKCPSGDNLIANLHDALAFALVHECWRFWLCFCCLDQFHVADDFLRHFIEKHLGCMSQEALCALCTAFSEEEEKDYYMNSSLLDEKIEIDDNSLRLYVSSNLPDGAHSPNIRNGEQVWDEDDVIQRILQSDLRAEMKKWIDLGKERLYKGRYVYWKMVTNQITGVHKAKVSETQVVETLNRQIYSQSPFGVYDYRHVVSPFLKWYIQNHLEQLADIKQAGTEDDKQNLGEE